MTLTHCVLLIALVLMVASLLSLLGVVLAGKALSLFLVAGLCLFVGVALGHA